MLFSLIAQVFSNAVEYGAGLPKNTCIVDFSPVRLSRTRLTLPAAPNTLTEWHHGKRSFAAPPGKPTEMRMYDRAEPFAAPWHHLH
jgi:hypothetical protein